jgi:hypothetical protein
MSYKIEREEAKLTEDDVVSVFNLLDTDDDSVLKPQ